MGLMDKVTTIKVNTIKVEMPLLMDKVTTIKVEMPLLTDKVTTNKVEKVMPQLSPAHSEVMPPCDLLSNDIIVYLIDFIEHSSLIFKCVINFTRSKLIKK